MMSKMSKEVRSTASKIGRISIIAAALTAFCFALCACSQPPEKPSFDVQSIKSVEGDYNCIVIYSQRANSLGNMEQYGLGYLKGAGESEGFIDVISADGKPSSRLNGGITIQPDEDLKNKKRRDQSVEGLLGDTLEEICTDGALDAQAPEVDLYEAMRLANKTFAKCDDIEDHENVVVIIDSGISTKGYVDFTQTSILNFDPDTFVNTLHADGSVDDTDLARIDRVEWYCFNEVAGAQAEIPGAQLQNKVKEFYEKLLASVGVGEVVFNDAPAGLDESDLPSDLPMVTPANVGTVVLDESSIKFESASDIYTSTEQATASLKTWAGILNSSDIAVTIHGYTDSRAYSVEGGNQALSEKRANRVKQTLVELGVSEDKISTIGEGESTAYPTDEENRRVELELTSL